MRPPRIRTRAATAIAIASVALASCAGPVVPPLPTQATPSITASQVGTPTISPAATAAPSITPKPTVPTFGIAPGSPLPARVFAPYMQMYNGDPVHVVAQESSARHMTLAFLETNGTESCDLGWNGATGFSDIMSTQLIVDSAALRRAGGDVIPSFGGYSADNTGREIGDSCADPEAIADGYASIVAMLGVTRLDMDIEDRSLERPDGIDRRNKALRILQDRLAAEGRTVEIQYTLPTSPKGLDASGLAVLQNAVANGTLVDIVNIMTFDYYDGSTTNMAAAAISAAEGLHAQLAKLYPGRTAAHLWAMVGITLMPGIDDYPQKTELTTLDHARQVLAFARAHGIANLSMWALQRDHGTCPGQPGNDDCSGIEQADWAFTKLLSGFTGP
jgi:hypothetical protein